jgi:hypothetical protein
VKLYPAALYSASGTPLWRIIKEKTLSSPKAPSRSLPTPSRCRYTAFDESGGLRNTNPLYKRRESLAFKPESKDAAAEKLKTPVLWTGACVTTAL